jgi:hypothetical protein
MLRSRRSRPLSTCRSAVILALAWVPLTMASHTVRCSAWVWQLQHPVHGAHAQGQRRFVQALAGWVLTAVDALLELLGHKDRQAVLGLFRGGVHGDGDGADDGGAAGGVGRGDVKGPLKYHPTVLETPRK